MTTMTGSTSKSATLAMTIAMAVASPVWAEEERELKEVVITATRTEAEAATVPATITSVSRPEMDARLPADEAGLFDDEPGVAMPRDLRRHGATRINIRGIEDNRVQMLVDGVRLPDFRNGGGPTNHTVNTPLPPNTEFLKRVEILRGPASSLYGSDALGGVASFLTLDPADLLAEGGRFGARYRLSGFTADQSLSNAVFFASRGEAVESLVGFVYRTGKELENQGDDRDVTSVDRTAPNPQEYRHKGLLAKVEMKPDADQKLTFTLEGGDQDTFTDVRRLSASLPKVTDMEADDVGERGRVSLDWEHKPGGSWYDRLTARLYHQQTETRNRTRQNRTNTSATCSAASGTGNNCYVELDYDVDQDLTGTGVQVETGFAAGGAEHLITFGADLARTETEEKRDGRVWNLTTGTFTKSLAGEVFPLRDFPPGHQDSLGLFIQDEVAAGRLTLVPGLRYDAIRLNAEPDDLTFQHAGRPPVDKDESAISPKLAARWQITPATSLWGQLARGFRAPNYEEINGSFRNTVQAYAVVPNPDLEPETSTGAEVGVKYNSGSVQAQIAAFDNRYQDFIEQKRLICPGDPSCISGLTTFQSVNIDKVRIYGVELRGSWGFTPGWKATGAVAYAHGHNETDDQPLNSIEPARVMLALARDADTWGAEARVNAATGVEHADNTQLSSGEWFKPDSWTSVDVSAWRRLAKHARINFAANNLFDEKYWLWGDVRLAGLRTIDAGPEFYTQPGRNFAASIQADF